MFISIVLAGERIGKGQKNELLEYCGVKAKSLININDKPMILYVLEALLKSNLIKDIYVIGPALLMEESWQLQKLEKENKIKFRKQMLSPAESVLSILKELNNENVFITTSDNVLLKLGWIDFFLNGAFKSGKDVLMAVNDYNRVVEKFPDTKRTVLKFRDISFCFCNLFAVMNENGYKVIELWRKVENMRKNPLKIARMIMPVWGLILFSMGLLSSKKAFKKMSKKLDADVGIIKMPYPEACIDVDKIEDLELVKKIINQ
ncbi:MAG: NTP transferase domain-containing protein [Deferribacterota bacterium]|nr:NTP transferase domain-containing protein [Deferribacterota bacterium]